MGISFWPLKKVYLYPACSGLLYGNREWPSMWLVERFCRLARLHFIIIDAIFGGGVHQLKQEIK